MATKSPRTAKAKGNVPARSLTSKWESLTWDDVEDWSGLGALSRGRDYQKRSLVHNLAVSLEGRLLATVIGGERYATTVWWKADRLDSICNCPVGASGCKHAVAVVAAYLDMLEKGTEVPVAEAEDERWEQLESGAAEADFDDGDEWEDDSEDDDDPPVQLLRSGKGRAASEAKIDKQDEKVRQYIEAKSKEDLAELVWSLTQRFPKLREEFRERIAFGDGNADRLLARARKELRRVTSEPGWTNKWKRGEGYTPDYSRLVRYLDQMIELGHADAVVKLSREVMARGMEQIGQSDDEGETAESFAECLPPIFRAVKVSSLTTTQKLLLKIDFALQDEYSILDCVPEAAEPSGNASPSDWSAVADELATRLKSGEPVGKEFCDKYQREQIADCLVDALTRAGRDHEVIAVLEREARITGNYPRLVSLLIEQKQYSEAEHWTAEGIQKTAKEAPGTAVNLASAMGEIARKHRNWSVVAAHAARDFFERPGCKGFTELVAAAERAGCRDAVERQALRFLETGKLPFVISVTKNGSCSADYLSDWPLKFPLYLLPLIRTGDSAPHYSVLIDMAIAERRPEDVLRWYGNWNAASEGQRAGWFYGAYNYGDKVAAAVTESHPERALDIYQGDVDGLLVIATIAAYEEVAGYLKKMRPILKSLGREGEWNDLVSGIRVKYGNRPRFMEILDRLEGGPILQKARARK